MKRLATVNQWYNTTDTATGPNSLLYQVLSIGSIFNHIYKPVKQPTADGMPDDFTYIDVGLTTSEIADAYVTLFNSNYLVEPMTKVNNSYANAVNNLARRVRSVYNLNKSKYLKLIELEGYEYNPLFNVDGVEDFTYLENDGSVTTSHDTTLGGYSDTASGNDTYTRNASDNVKTNEHKTATYDDPNYRNNEQDTITDSFKQTDTYGKVNTHSSQTNTDTSTITHGNAKNGNAEYSGGKDTFGNNVVGGDKYHNERKVRQGNIGVTKTQELIAAERDNLKFSVINEFFKDINEYILVGIY